MIKSGRHTHIALSALLLSLSLSCSRDIVTSSNETCCGQGDSNHAFDTSNHDSPRDMNAPQRDMPTVGGDMLTLDLGDRPIPDASVDELGADAGGMDPTTPVDMSAPKEMGMAELPRGFEHCDCDHPDAICKFNRCYFPRDCENLGCPDGFGVCMAGTLCDCDGEWGSPECAPNCTTMEDCPHDAFCGPGGKCVEQPGCSKSYQCPLGMWCNGSFCEKPGERPTGADCLGGSQCESGYCEPNLGECKARCFLDTDCPEGEACYLPDNYCVSGTYSCNVTCPAGTNCRQNRCKRPRCNWTADCEEGDCQVVPESVGNCLDNEQTCKPNEFRSRPEDVFCRIFLSCGDDEDCPGGYTCESDGYEGIPYHRNLCSRLP